MKDNLCDFQFSFPANQSFLKKAYCKRKESAPTGSKFFPFRVDLFSEGKNQFETVISLKTI